MILCMEITVLVLFIDPDALTAKIHSCYRKKPSCVCVKCVSNNMSVYVRAHVYKFTRLCEYYGVFIGALYLKKLLHITYR